ncbi:MAG: glycosyltransferase [Paludibacteraceae bacterium]|nr:glycosyltransferase [Paludibacteraceae bacterium]
MSVKLSIVTINFNDAAGLQKTLRSVEEQTCKELEHVIIDGGSKDDSKSVIEEYARKADYSVVWVSEPDNGIYNGMNKGLKKATGDYIQILNSGDMLAAANVVERMMQALKDNDYPNMLYGNMIKAMPDGRLLTDRATKGSMYNPSSFLYFYKGTMNHDSVYIRRELFDKYGLYDEQMKICSDWKWFVDAVAVGGERPVYVDIDVTIFDMGGVSESGGKNKDLIARERRDYLQKVVPASVLSDYDNFSFAVFQYQRLKKHHLWGLVNFIERILFKLEKWRIIR